MTTKTLTDELAEVIAEALERNRQLPLSQRKSHSDAAAQAIADRLEQVGFAYFNDETIAHRNYLVRLEDENGRGLSSKWEPVYRLKDKP